MTSTITYQQAAGGAYLANGRCTHRRQKMHTHGEYTLGVVVRGRQIIHLRNRQFEAPAGTAYLIAPGEPHRGFATGPGSWAYLSLYVPAELMQEVFLATAERRDESVTGVYRDAELSQSLLCLARATDGHSRYVEWRDGLLRAIARLTRLCPDHANERTQPEPAAIRQVKSTIRARLDEPLAVEWLAALVGWSPEYLVRTFKRHVGISPYAWLVAERLNRVVAELKGGAAPAQAALRAGFYDQSHMCRHFTRAFQTTPARFQRQLMAG